MTAGVRAVRVATPGGRPRVEAVPVGPVAGDEVEVAMEYAAVNPVDTYVARGWLGGAAFPRTLGVEGAGTVDGRRVVVYGHGVGVVRAGTWAERVVVPVDATVPIPDGVDTRSAAAVAVAGTTAVRVVRGLAKVTCFDRVLVLGAAGGVGCAVLSLLRSLGADVWGQTAAAAKAGTVSAYGATPVVAASAPELAAALGDATFTVVLDPLGGDHLAVALEHLTPHGRLVTYGTSAGAVAPVNVQTLYRRNLVVHGYGGVGQPPHRIREGIASALTALRDGQLDIRVSRVLPLQDAATAVDLLAARDVVGKLLLRPA